VPALVLAHNTNLRKLPLTFPERARKNSTASGGKGLGGGGEQTYFLSYDRHDDGSARRNGPDGRQHSDPAARRSSVRQATGRNGPNPLRMVHG
jgi:hypothetical protein